MHLLLLAACTQPPTLQASAAWVPSPCGQQEIAVSIQTEPGVQLTLERLGQPPLSGVADAQGQLTLSMPLEQYGRLTLRGDNGSEPSTLSVPPPPPTVQNRATVGKLTGKLSVANFCLSAGDARPACKLGMDPWGVGMGAVPDGATLNVGAQSGSKEPGKATVWVPVPLDSLASWDFGVFNQPLEQCPHLAITGVSAEVEGTTYSGEVWTGRVGAEHALAQALGETLSGSPWPPAPTSDVALILHRSSDAPEANHSFVGWSGEPGPLSDVRFLVRRTESKVELGSCGIYTEERTGAQREVFDSRRDLQVQVFERHTGALLSETTVQGKNAGCGPIAFGVAQGSALPEEKAQAWIDAELSALR